MDTNVKKKALSAGLTAQLFQGDMFSLASCIVMALKYT